MSSITLSDLPYIPKQRKLDPETTLPPSPPKQGFTAVTCPLHKKISNPSIQSSLHNPHIISSSQPRSNPTFLPPTPPPNKYTYQNTNQSRIQKKLFNRHSEARYTPCGDDQIHATSSSTSIIKKPPSPKLRPLTLPIRPPLIRDQIYFLDTFLSSQDYVSKFRHFSFLQLPNTPLENITKDSLDSLNAFFREAESIVSTIWKCFLSSEEKKLFLSETKSTFANCLKEFVSYLDFGINNQRLFMKKIIESPAEDRALFSHYSLTVLPPGMKDIPPPHIHKMFFDACKNIIASIRNALTTSQLTANELIPETSTLLRNPDAFLDFLRQNKNMNISMQNPLFV